MDKNTYETYEFLPATAAEADSEQFFVVQSDGSFLLNRQIQYVAQVQDVKEVLEDVQPCTVYGVGVTSQQFFVDVDNSTELISVSDQFMLPDSENGLYTNSFLLQPGSSTAGEQMEENVVNNQLKPPNLQEVDANIATHDSKQGNNFTEITLSDEQYQTLEQKGWLLLESNDKTYVLNTLGLHDITSDDKLIQKLRNEIQNCPNSDMNSGTFKIENVAMHANQFPNIVAQSLADQQDTVELIIASNDEQDDNMESLQFVADDDNTDNATTPLEIDEKVDILNHVQEADLKSNIKEIAVIKKETLKDTNCLKIKTKYNFKDIPEKIVLGKTANGKRLVAKLTKKNNGSNVKSDHTDKNSTPEVQTKNVTDLQKNCNKNVMSETELVSLIQQSIRNISQAKLSAEDISSAQGVVGQLLKMPNIKDLLIGNDLIVTKIKNVKKELGRKISGNNAILVTGHVTEKEDSSATFEHIPELLHTFKAKSEALLNNGDLECIDHEYEACTIFHVHVTETKSDDNVVRVAVTLNKRQLSVIQMFDLKRRHPNTVFACSACATLFKSKEVLQEHQENDCLETEEEALTIDTDKIDMAAYSVIKTEKEKKYKCTQCEVQFSKLYSCVRHVKTHMGFHQNKLDEKTKTDSDEDKQTKHNRKVFKCKMCPSTYFHPATLSKHIVTRHIKVKTK